MRRLLLEATSASAVLKVSYCVLAEAGEKTRIPDKNKKIPKYLETAKCGWPGILQHSDWFVVPSVKSTLLSSALS